MSRIGDFIDVHVTRAQKIVALLVGIITLIAAIAGAVVWLNKKLAAPSHASERSWAPLVDAPSPSNVWGPERLGRAAAEQTNWVELNTIKDQPSYGDERNFFRARDVTAGTDWSDSVELKRGDEFQAAVYYHNDSNTDSATYCHVRVEMPAIVPAEATDGKNIGLAYLTASNGQPSEVHDSIKFINRTQADFAIRNLDGTAHVVSDTKTNGMKVNEDALFGKDGALLGADAFDGTLPAGQHGQGWIVFKFVAVQPNFVFENRLRLAGTKEWKRELTAQPGDHIEVSLNYLNTGDTKQDNVTLETRWPPGIEYTPGHTTVYNQSEPDGMSGASMDGIATPGGGLNIGDYADGTNAQVIAAGTVTAPPCSVIDFPAVALTTNGDKEDHSTLQVSGTNCAGQ